MNTIEHRYPDGTKATYIVAPDSTLPLQIMLIKPIKRPIRVASEKRRFPRHEAHWSTADYIKRYFALNSQLYHNVTAYYHPLPDAPAATYTGIDSVEVLP